MQLLHFIVVLFGFTQVADLEVCLQLLSLGLKFFDDFIEAFIDVLGLRLI